jgi:CheY-like chemotaxis protein
MTLEHEDLAHAGDIMIVDDAPENLKFLRELLTQSGYQVRAANDGELALRSVQAKLPALILLDVRMPGMDGFEVCRRLKADWWEKFSKGKTIGARLELLQEFHEFSGNRILIYQTANFLEHALERFNQTTDSNAVEEIRAISALRAEKENAVKIIEQDIINSSVSEQYGFLRLNLNRPVRNLTGSGRLDPRMNGVPKLEVRLLQTPPNIPKHYITSGAGTNFNFNVHVRLNNSYDILPVGEYVFEYKAICENVELGSDEIVLDEEF